MTTEKREFLASQYADGTLDADRVEAVEAMLRDDATMRAALEDHRRVTAALRDRTPLPAIRWDQLADAVSQNIESAEEERVRGRFRMPAFARWAAGAATVAACAVVGFLALRQTSFKESANPGLVAAARSIVVTGPLAEASIDGKPVISVSIAPPTTVAGLPPMAWDELQIAPSQVLVAGGEPTFVPDPFSGQ